MLKFRDWIVFSKLNLQKLSTNPNALQFLETNPQYINWFALSKNKNAVHLLEKNISKIWGSNLSINPNAISLLKQYPHLIDWDIIQANPNAMSLINEMFIKTPNKIDWMTLSENPNAIEILEDHFDKIYWYGFCLNPNPIAIEILVKHIQHVYWGMLSLNPGAYNILKTPEFKDKLVWENMCQVPDANIFSLVQKEWNENPIQTNKKINWCGLSSNPYAIHLLEQNQNKINWLYLSENPEIFEYDYVKMKNTTGVFKEELMMKAWHPTRVIQWLEQGYEDM
jgi:hypothetical protein